eukprot:5950596-Prymnesium_polylepis.1
MSASGGDEASTSTAHTQMRYLVGEYGTAAGGAQLSIGADAQAVAIEEAASEGRHRTQAVAIEGAASDGRRRRQSPPTVERAASPTAENTSKKGRRASEATAATTPHRTDRAPAATAASRRNHAGGAAAPPRLVRLPPSFEMVSRLRLARALIVWRQYAPLRAAAARLAAKHTARLDSVRSKCEDVVAALQASAHEMEARAARSAEAHEVAQATFSRMLEEAEELRAAQALQAHQAIVALQRKAVADKGAALDALQAAHASELEALRVEAAKEQQRLAAEAAQKHAAELARAQRLLTDAKNDAAREARRREAKANADARALEERCAARIAPLEALVAEQHEEVRRLRTKGVHDEQTIAKLQRRIRELLDEVEDLTRIRDSRAHSPPRARRVGGGF